MTDDPPTAESRSIEGPSWDSPHLLVIIVNFRTPDLVIQCLESLVAEIPTVPGTRVVVVENGSGDGSDQRIREAIDQRAWGEWARVLPLEENLGFAGGNNRGWELAPSADYGLLLNSDTIVHPGCLAHCMKTLKDDASIGAMSCLVKNADGSPQNVSRTFPTPLRLVVRSLGLPWRLPGLFGWADTDDLTWDREKVCRDVDWLGGAFLFIRGDLIRNIGLLDEDFFFYGEDIEFSHRVWKAGYRCYYQATPGSITHLGGASSGKGPNVSNENLTRRFRARYLVQRKCYGVAAQGFLRCWDLTLWFCRAMGRKWLRGTEDPSALEARQVCSVLRGPL